MGFSMKYTIQPLGYPHDELETSMETYKEHHWINMINPLHDVGNLALSGVVTQ